MYFKLDENYALTFVHFYYKTYGLTIINFLLSEITEKQK